MTIQDEATVLTGTFSVCTEALWNLPPEMRQRVLRAINALFQEPPEVPMKSGGTTLTLQQLDAINRMTPIGPGTVYK